MLFVARKLEIARSAPLYIYVLMYINTNLVDKLVDSVNGIGG